MVAKLHPHWAPLHDCPHQEIEVLEAISDAHGMHDDDLLNAVGFHGCHDVGVARSKSVIRTATGGERVTGGLPGESDEDRIGCATMKEGSVDVRFVVWCP